MSVLVWLLFSFSHLVLSWAFCVLVARMDPALLREGERFKKRALSTPAVEKRPVSSDSGTHKKKQPIVDGGSSSGSNLSAGKWGDLRTWGISAAPASSYIFKVKSVIFIHACKISRFLYVELWCLKLQASGRHLVYWLQNLSLQRWLNLLAGQAEFTTPLWMQMQC